MTIGVKFEAYFHKAVELDLYGSGQILNAEL